MKLKLFQDNVVSRVTTV